MALQFNGTTDIVSLNQNFGEGATNGSPFTWSVVIFVDTVAPSDQVFLGRNDGTALFQLALSGSTLRPAWGQSPFQAIAAGSVSVGGWFHVGFTWSSTGTATSYLNAVAQGTAANSVGEYTSAEAIALGDRSDGVAPFQGRIAEVAFWNAELTAGEIRAVGIGTPAYRVRPASLVSYLPLLRSLRDVWGAVSASATGTTEAAHTRLYLAGLQGMGAPAAPPAPAGNRRRRVLMCAR